jgi:hypothetical protein
LNKSSAVLLRQHLKEDILTMDVELGSPIFSEEYEMLGAQPALYGGAEVIVAFMESKLYLDFGCIRWSGSIL